MATSYGLTALSVTITSTDLLFLESVLFKLFRCVILFLCSTCHQVERMPILIDSPKKLDHQLSSDPDKTPVSNAANSDSEPEDMNPPGEEIPV